MFLVTSLKPHWLLNNLSLRLINVTMSGELEGGRAGVGAKYQVISLAWQAQFSNQWKEIK